MGGGCGNVQLKEEIIPKRKAARADGSMLAPNPENSSHSTAINNMAGRGRMTAVFQEKRASSLQQRLTGSANTGCTPKSCPGSSPSPSGITPSTVYPHKRERPKCSTIEALRALIGQKSGQLPSNASNKLIAKSPQASTKKRVVIGGVVQPSTLTSCTSHTVSSSSSSALPYVPPSQRSVPRTRIHSTVRDQPPTMKRRSSPYKLDEYDEDDLNFIDDDVESASSNWRAALRGITGYDPNMFCSTEEEASEASLHQQQYEERHSARIAALEDAEELRKIQEEEMKAARHKNSKKRLRRG